MPEPPGPDLWNASLLPHEQQMHLAAMNAVKPGVLDSYKFGTEQNTISEGSKGVTKGPPIVGDTAYPHTDHIKASQSGP